jgi:hypothetical protein
MNNDSVLKKEFKERDVQRLRNIVSKNYSDRTITQVGYTKEQVEYKEGDVWEENGKNWTIKNGIKMTITKLDLVKKTLQMPLVCPKCKKAMNKGNLDKQMYAVHHTCSDCVFEHETKLKRDGKFEEYQQNILKQGVQYHIKEIEDALLDLAMNTSEESFVTEAGDIETWKGNGLDKEEITKWMQDYLDNLKATIKP